MLKRLLNPLFVYKALFDIKYYSNIVAEDDTKIHFK